jgi:hypothetical protein
MYESEFTVPIILKKVDSFNELGILLFLKHEVADERNMGI